MGDERAIVKFEDDVDDQTGREVRRQMMGDSITDYSSGKFKDSFKDAFDWTDSLYPSNPKKRAWLNRLT